MLSSSSQLSEEHETAWMNRQLIQLSNLHSPYNMSDIEFVVNPTSKHAVRPQATFSNPSLQPDSSVSLSDIFNFQILI